MISTLKIIIFFVFIVLVTVSCNKSEIEELESRISDLEKIKTDTVYVNTHSADTFYLYSTSTDTLFIHTIDTLYFETPVLLVNDTVLLSDININNQESLNLFIGMDIRHIAGDLTITNCTDLSPLSPLKTVGNLDINAQVPSYEAFDNLEKIHTNLRISNTDNIDVIGFNNLVSIGGSIALEANGGIVGFNLLEKIESSVPLKYYANWATYTHSINGLLIEANFVDGFNSLVDVEDIFINVWTIDLVEESEVTGFESVTQINSLSVNTFNMSANAFSNLSNVIASIRFNSYFGEQVDLKNFQSVFPSLESIGSLFAGNVTINPESFPVLKSIKNGADIRIKITDWLLLFEKLDSIGGTLTVENAGDNIKILSELNTIRVGGLTVSNCTGLESLKGVEFLNNETTNNVSISGCPKLVDLTPLSVSVGFEWVSIYENASLINLNGLESISDITNINIASNPLLDDFCGIKNSIDNSEQIYIYDNLSNPQNSSEIIGCN